eukprot:16361436-Heterocapsa_arctica.AAC.1
MGSGGTGNLEAEGWQPAQHRRHRPRGHQGQGSQGHRGHPMGSPGRPAPRAGGASGRCMDAPGQASSTTRRPSARRMHQIGHDRGPMDTAEALREG